MNKIPIEHTAEAAALSLIAVDAECLSQLSWKAEYFALDGHRAVFTALVRVARRTGTTGALAAISELETTGKLELCGGRRAVVELLKTVFIAPGPICVSIAADYRSQLVKAAGYREAIKAWEEAEPDIRGMRGDLPALAEVFARAGTDKSESIESLKDQLNALIDDLERRTPLESFCLGVPSLDRAFRGGIFRGEMLVIGAETSGGKSILLQQAALQAALAGKKVVFFSLEMPAKEILRRMACNLVGKRIADASEILATENQQSLASTRDLTCALGRLMGLPLIIRDDLGEVGEIDGESRRLAAAGLADLIIVDYLQIVTMPKADTREQAISEFARRLKLTALKTKSAVFSATQLNEDGKIRESRAIGMHADNVIFIEHTEGRSMFRIKKNRRGPRDITVPCTMRGDISRFEESHE